MPIGLLGGACRDRIDHHDFGSARLRLSDERPVVQVVADGVDGPEDDVFRVDKAFRIDRGGRAAGHKKGANRSRIAECPFGHNGAEFVEECVAGV